MKLFNWESPKKTDKKIEQENIPIHEEIDRKNNPTKNLDTDIYQPEIIEEEERLNKNDPEKKFIPIENIPDDFNLENYILEKIDNSTKDETEEELTEIKAPATTHLPMEVKKIIQKYSLPKNEWQKLSQTERKNRLNNINAEIAELYVKQRKKMVPKKNKPESAEKAA